MTDCIATCADDDTRAREADTPPARTASQAPAWWAVISLAVGAFSTVTTEFLPIGLLTQVSQGMGVTDGTAGLMLTMPAVVAAFAGPLLIVLSGKLDRRLVLIGLSALLVVSNALAALAPNFATVLVARVLLGLCVGGFWTFAPGATGHLVPAALQPRAMSYVLAGISLATVAGVPAGAFLGNLMGWRAAFGVAAVISGLVLIVQWRLLPKMPTARATAPRDLLAPLWQRGSRLGLMVTVFLVAGHFTAYTYLTPLLQQVFGLTPDAVTGLLLAYGAAGFFSTFVGGWLVARSVPGTAALTALLIATVLSVAALFGDGGPVVATLVTVVWGIAFGLVPVSMTAWMLEALPDAPEAGQAMLVTGFQVAVASGALFGGLLVDGHGVVSAMWLGAALSLAAVAVVAASNGTRARRPGLA